MQTAWLVLLLVALGGYLSLLGKPAHAQESDTGIPLEQLNSAVQAELEDDANDIPDTAILLVYSDTEWVGTVVGSDLGSSPATGSNDEKIQFPCEGEIGRYNASFQKQTDEGYLAIAAIQNRKLLNSTSTESPLGIVNIGGFCGDVEEAPSTTVRDSACLIATAAFGSELAPQVQYLREFRDERILSTAAGASFMSAFNSVYYSFSPQVADYERDQPWLQDVVRVAIYPLLGILTISENMYSAGEGEYGAIAAGVMASSMIGAVYLAPLAFSIRQIREEKPRYRIFALVTVGASLALAASLWTEDMAAMMITTSALVLSISSVSALTVAGTLAWFFRRAAGKK